MWRRLWPSALLLLQACSGGGSSGSTTFVPLPQWSGLRHDIANTGTGSGAVAENTGTPICVVGEDAQCAVSDVASSPPAIAVHGEIYVGTMTGLVALDENLNERTRFEECASTTALPTSSPACIDKPVGPVTISPAVSAGDDVVVVAASGCVFVVKDEGSGFSCRWAAQPSPGFCQPSETRRCAGSSAQVLVDSRDLSLTSVFVGTADGGLLALNGNGTLRWRFPADGSSLGGPVTSAPAFANNAIFFAAPNGVLYALDFAGRIGWSAPTLLGPVGTVLQPSPATSFAVYLPGADGNIVAYNPDGTAKWRFPAHAPVLGSVAVASQQVQDPNDTSSTFEPIVYAVDTDGTLYGLRDSDGTVLEVPRCSDKPDKSCTVDTCPVGEGTCVDRVCSMSRTFCIPEHCPADQGTCVDGACSVSQEPCIADNCPADQGTCVDGICSNSQTSCSGDTCLPDGSCTVHDAQLAMSEESIEVTASPSVSGDLYALVGTRSGSVCARLLFGTLPDADTWQTGCVSVGSGEPIADSPVVDARGRIFVISGSTLYAIE
jgi:outer membrane protein assembly factor BamB